MFDEVFVRYLGKASALISVKEYVIAPYRDLVTGVKSGEGYVKFDFVVLESDEW